VRRLATIDLGTNTVRLLVVEASGPEWRALHEEQSVTRLGQGQAATGLLQQAAMKRTVDVVAAFVRRAEGLGVGDVRIVATSAVREAGNGPEFLAMVGASSDRQVRVISGEEEARLTLLGVADGLPDLRGHFLLFDIPGGGAPSSCSPRGGPAATGLRLSVVRLAGLHGQAPVDADAARGLEVATRLAAGLTDPVLGTARHARGPARAR
jgi:exopolyphosphatase/guanosine-5'-triphosphate,3'-diphosphate pyrophosphatase